MAEQPLVGNGRYRLLKAAGQGATANVYRAEEVDGGRAVAIKVLRPGMKEKAEMVARLRREAELMERLNHPNIVKLLALEDAKEGLLLVLEWVEGKRLDVLIAEQPLAFPRALLLLTQLARALSAIHSEGIVHRDLKPENVMIEALPDGKERLRLLDFGIARFQDSALSANSFSTAAGQIAGTPAYLSPEQAEGKRPDVRSDVYAFGVIGYRMLSGALPFSGDDLKMLSQHIKARPPALQPSDPAWKKSPVIPLLMRCLEKSPDARPANGLALFQEIKAAAAKGIGA